MALRPGGPQSQTTMKSAVLARPNLKVLLLGAIVLVVVQNFFADGGFPMTSVHARSAPRAEPGSPSELRQLLERAGNAPTSQLYVRISRCYEKRGDIRKALLYVRKAEVLAQIEEASD